MDVEHSSSIYTKFLWINEFFFKNGNVFFFGTFMHFLGNCSVSAGEILDIYWAHDQSCWPHFTDVSFTVPLTVIHTSAVWSPAQCRTCVELCRLSGPVHSAAHMSGSQQVRGQLEKVSSSSLGAGSHNDRKENLLKVLLWKNGESPILTETGKPQQGLTCKKNEHPTQWFYSSESYIFSHGHFLCIFIQIVQNPRWTCLGLVKIACNRT